MYSSPFSPSARHHYHNRGMYVFFFIGKRVDTHSFFGWTCSFLFFFFFFSQNNEVWSCKGNSFYFCLLISFFFLFFFFLSPFFFFLLSHLFSLIVRQSFSQEGFLSVCEFVLIFSKKDEIL